MRRDSPRQGSTMGEGRGAREREGGKEGERWLSLVRLRCECDTDNTPKRAGEGRGSAKDGRSEELEALLVVDGAVIRHH